MKLTNILVALDLSDLDNLLIKYAEYFANNHQVENVYFIHNIKKYEIADLFSEQLEELHIDSIIEQKLEEQLDQNFNSKCNSELLVSEDPYTESLIAYVANKYKADLVILGNKNAYKGTGALSGKLLRLLKCSIFSIPEEAQMIKNDRFIVTTDFSSASHRAIRAAVSLIGDGNLSKLSILHVYKIPKLFFPYIKVDEAIHEVQIHVAKLFAKLLRKLKLSGIDTLGVAAGSDAISKKIKNTAEKEKADILFISDRGNNNFTNLMVGSVTEELFTHDLFVPLWVIK